MAIEDAINNRVDQLDQALAAVQKSRERLRVADERMQTFGAITDFVEQKKAEAARTAAQSELHADQHKVEAQPKILDALKSERSGKITRRISYAALVISVISALATTYNALKDVP